MNAMGQDFELLQQIVRHRLAQEDIDHILQRLSADDRSVLLEKMGAVLRHMSALIDVHNRISGFLSLDEVLVRLMAAITETLYAERSTLFLFDPDTNELFSRVAQGEEIREIRIPSTQGIAGAVFTSRQGMHIPDVYADPRFNQEMDRKTGYRTRNMLCTPLRNREGTVIGVAQVLNKIGRGFSGNDMALLEAITTQASAAVESSKLYEQVQRAHRDEQQMMEITTALSSELHLDTLLTRIMAITTELLHAERSTLFLHDAKTHELWSLVAEGVKTSQIRFPAERGIAGTVFTTGETVNIHDAYADPRFNQEVDRQTGYHTHNMLCMPVTTKEGRTIAVTQVLNKRGGSFTPRDEKRLQALSAQVAIALENARLFEEVVHERNYSESILNSMSSAVITLDADLRIIKCNPAVGPLLGWRDGTPPREALIEAIGLDNAWILDRIAKVREAGIRDHTVDTELVLQGRSAVSINLTVVPLIDIKQRPIGYMLVLDDITAEKRLKNTMSRYLNRELTERLLSEGEQVLGGKIQEVTILFSDIRSFTTIAERSGARETVSMLNDYFSVMVEILFKHKGILDKYIGDAMMALFGTPFTTPQDADNAVAAAVEMMHALKEFNTGRLHSHEPIHIGIGINTGEVVAGNIGSPKRMDYTVIGDGVNLGSRLEGTNKYYGTQILVSEFTKQRLAEPHVWRELDLIRVKGKAQPIAVFEVLDHFDATDFPHRDEVLGHFAAGLGHYRAHRFDRSWDEFKAALALHPHDIPSRIFLERSHHYRAHPPAAEWDGVWTMHDK
jgi:adenylate cyclase